MKLIIGLGNPGKQYQNTKHSLGFIAADLLAENLLGKNIKWNENKKAKCLYLKSEINNESIEIVKPQTFMNNSGITVSHIVKKHNLIPEDIFIVYDDIDIESGDIKIGFFESSAGHKGIKSIVQYLGFKNFLRFRIGIKTPKLNKMPADKYVLSRISLFEKSKINKALNKTVEAIQTAIKESPETAMNKFN